MTEQAPRVMADEHVSAARTKKIVCAITGRELPRKRLVVADSLRPTLLDRIREDYPNLADDGYIDLTEVERYRTIYVEEMLKLEHGELSELDQQVADSMAHHETVVENIEDEFDEHRSFGERVSDHLASFGGSWAFLISFFVVLLLWMGINVAMGDDKAFDPYPFILLNLVLSCIAAIQAPIIMMSQKRQEAKDRLRALNDYKVNLKAELEIRHVQEKLDYLLTKQWQRLSEMQQMQMELMQENVMRLRVAERRNKVPKKVAKVKAVALPLGENGVETVMSGQKFVKTVAKAVAKTAAKTAKKKAARVAEVAANAVPVDTLFDVEPVVQVPEPVVEELAAKQQAAKTASSKVSTAKSSAAKAPRASAAKKKEDQPD
jgi:uncharacterized membrane protein